MSADGPAVALYYADASALVKLVRDEPESPALRAFLDDADGVSSELVLTEVPRAIRRATSLDPSLPVTRLLERATLVTYDERQSAAARLAGLRTIAPGA